MRKIKDLSRATSTPSRTRCEYFAWLCGLVGIDKEHHNNEALAKQLHEAEFTWMVMNDDNRAEDGKKLREIFVLETGSPQGAYLDGPCSVLEMLIGVAIRMETMLEDPRHGDRTSVWFWEIMHNLELDQFTDDYPGEDWEMHTVGITRRLLNRTYQRNGEGGLFPLRRARTDQRQVEIWYQMMAYLAENHAI